MSPLESNRIHYLTSLTEELSAQSTRVRDLIGSRHWLSDGHHKEYILGSVISRHLPAGILLGRGFVISPAEPHQCSTEQDLLLVDCTTEAPIFNQGGLLIAFPNQVIAAVSVKTTLRRKEATDAVRGLNSVRTLVNLASPEPNHFWCGVFVFETTSAVDRNPRLPCDYLSRAIADNPVSPPPFSAQPSLSGPDLLCASKDLIYKNAPPATHASPFITGYRCNSLGTAVFLANLLDHVATYRTPGASNLAAFVDTLSLTPL